MMIMKSILLGIAFAFVLSGCGGVDLEDDTLLWPQPSDIVGPPIDESNIDVSVAEIAGVWDFTYEVKGLDGNPLFLSERVVVITEDGGYYEYDFMGDERAARGENFGNCYRLLNAGKIYKEPFGGFRIEFGTSNIVFSMYSNFDLQDDKLVSALQPGSDCRCDDQIILAPPFPMGKAELDAMLCED